jgi:diguanylate cyclase (GGDEF)-like protein
MMNSDITEIINMRSWNRNMLNAYWFILIALIIGEFIYYVASYDKWLFGMDNICMHAAIIIGILCLTEYMNYRLNHYNEYIIIISGTLIVSTILYTYSNIPALYNASFLPILISVFYFQVRKVLFSFSVMIIVLFTLYFVKNLNSTDDKVLLIEFITTLAILVSGTVICLGIMHRGIELVKRLRSTMESRQQLLVQNIIMDKLSKTDPLTQLYNHITFHEYLSELTEQSDNFGLSLQLAVIDIDNFKKVNDTFGHRAGDAILKRIAQSLEQHMVANDFVARYGGEEFAILFTEKKLDDVYQILDQVRQQIAEIDHPELDSQMVTISVGLTEYKRGTGKEVVFRQADKALYIAKKSGKNRIFIMTEEVSRIYN